jgi:hypothetical protein
MTDCPHCASALRSPWEYDPCPTIRSPNGLTNADLAVRVLEASPGPLSIYDIQRGIEREVGWSPGKPSLNVSVANDLRCCWAGRGLYGMYRHGFLPGPRRLLDVARIVLLSHVEPLRLDEVSHAMKDLGYRFQDQSIRAALVNSSGFEVREVSWMRFTVSRSPKAIADLRRTLQVAPSKADFDDLLERTRDRVLRALERRREVLRRSRRGLTPSDPIYTDGSQPPVV